MAKILVVDDEPSIGHVIRLLLEAEGHSVLIADDGQRGFATASRQRPDAIVLDLMMPVMDGFAVLEALRSDERTNRIPAVMLSAVRTDSVEQRCYRLGARSFVRKPFAPGELVAAVDAALPDATLTGTETVRDPLE